MKDDRKDLPPATDPNFLQRVRETLMVYLGSQGDPLKRGLMVGDLSDAGIVALDPAYTSGRGGLNNPIAGIGSSVAAAKTAVDLTPPPSPSGFFVSAGISNLMIQTGAPTFTQGHGYARTKLYGYAWTGGVLPTFSNALLLTEFIGEVASYATNPSTTWHLWVTWVTVDGVESVIPTGGTNGKVVRTGEDVALLLSALTGEITASQLGTSLGSTINLIDAPSTTSGSVAARIKSESDARIAAVVAEANARVTAITDEAATRTNAIASLQTQFNTLVAAGSGDFSTLIAALQEEQTARTAADVAEALSRTTLATQMRGDYAGTDLSLVTSGLIYAERQARSTENASFASDISGLSAAGSYRDDMAEINRLGDQALYASERVFTEASLSTERAVRTSAVEAVASEVTTLSASVTSNNATQTASLAIEASVRAGQTGALFAQYTVKQDVAGLISGYGLASTASTAAPSSAFGINANQFFISPPHFASNLAPTDNLYDGFCWLDTGVTPNVTRYRSGSSWSTVSPSLPFIVQSTPTTINGVAVPAGVYANDLYVRNGTITNAKIGNAAIDDAKIANLSAGKITAGSIAVGEYIQSSSFVSGASGWRISGNGTAELSNAIVRGTVYATDGQFFGTLLGGSAASYTSGSGFYSGATGSSYRWRVGAPTGARIQWTGSAIEVYDASNTLTLSSGGVSWAGVSGKPVFGYLAGLDSVGYSAVTGTKPPADADKTSSNTAAGIAGQGAFATLNQIDRYNIGTYMGTAAIDTAYIANAAIKSAHIDNLQVTTVKIGDNAVTVPMGWSGWSSIPELFMYLDAPATIFVSVMANALASGGGNTGSFYVASTCDYVSGPVVGVSLLDGFSGSATAIGTFGPLGVGWHRISGNAYFDYGGGIARYVATTGIFAIGVKK